MTGWTHPTSPPYEEGRISEGSTKHEHQDQDLTEDRISEHHT
jgi:hypothetical protein